MKGTTDPAAIFSLDLGCYSISQSSRQLASLRLAAGAIIHQNGLHPEHQHRYTLGTILLSAPSLATSATNVRPPDGSGGAAAVDEVADDHKMEGAPLLNL
jgi:hypothetical protein